MKNLHIVSTNHCKGASTEAYTAKAIIGNIRINAVYNVLTGDLMVDKWYLFDDADLAELTTALTDHFQRLCA